MMVYDGPDYGYYGGANPEELPGDKHIRRMKDELMIHIDSFEKYKFWTWWVYNKKYLELKDKVVNHHEHFPEYYL